MSRRTSLITLALALTLVLVIGLAGPAQAAWTDLTPTDLTAYNISEAQVAQISSGLTATNWAPYNVMTRAQFAKMAVAAFGLALANPAVPSFSDVPAHDYYYQHIEAAVAAGLLNGVGAGMFDPQAPITREQAAKIVAMQVARQNLQDPNVVLDDALATAYLAQFTDAASVGPNLKRAVAFAASHELVSGNAMGMLSAKTSLSRIQGAAMLIRCWQQAVTGPPLTLKEHVGKLLFMDKDLSSPQGQACATCHGSVSGFVGPDSAHNLATAVYPGAVSTLFGNRKPPAAAYASFSPALGIVGGIYIGGQFWDGRANTLADQAKGPYLNPLEQNNADAAAVVAAVKASAYAGLFRQVYGATALDASMTAYNFIADAVAAYESSGEVNQFSSKYDAFLAGKAQLTAQEANGLAVFNDPLKGNCAACHPSTVGPYSAHPLFTDYSYDNLGVPKNPANPFYTIPAQFNPAGAAWVDLGLGVTVADPLQEGKVKVPTLRNVDKRPYDTFVKAFAHNGYFKSLTDIVNFYNTRDVPGAGWPAPEVPQNVNVTEMGNLGLTAAEVADIVAFLKTLTDGYMVPGP